MYKKLLNILILGSALLVLFPTLVLSQEKEKLEYVPTVLFLAAQCGPVEIVSNKLKDKHGEVPFAVGNGMVILAQNGEPIPAQLVLTVNPDTMTFTVNAVLPDMNTCLVISGNSFAPAMLKKKKIQYIKPDLQVVAPGWMF
jgi:hypothetical protein|tara:strand:- start:1893 stop:2315 length:423 start_codon:yes stop_codon:yes gene_type:complete